MTIDFIGNANGFVIITSALFAIAQYADNYNLSNTNAIIDEIDTCDNGKEFVSSSDELRTIYDDVKNHEVRRLTKEISIFYFMLLLCAVTEVGLLSCPTMLWVKYTLIIIGIALVLAGGWLGLVVLSLGKVRYKLKKKVNSFKQMCLISRQVTSK